MRWMKWIGIASVIILIIACFNPWVIIESRNITVSGVKADGTNFGIPGYLHFTFSIFFILFTLIPRVWAKRANLLVTGINLGWAIRNYFMISACSGGECPTKKIWLYLVGISSILMLVSALFPDIELKEK